MWINHQGQTCVFEGAIFGGFLIHRGNDNWMVGSPTLEFAGPRGFSRGSGGMIRQPLNKRSISAAVWELLEKIRPASRAVS